MAALCSHTSPLPAPARGGAPFLALCVHCAFVRVRTFLSVCLQLSCQPKKESCAMLLLRLWRLCGNCFYGRVEQFR